MDQFEVVMIGNTAVGKTSMLSALSNELDAYNLSGRVSLKPTTHEFRRLQDQWNKMMEKVESQAPFTTLSDGTEGTLADFVEHKFDFKVDGAKKATVLFTDTRGGMTGELDENLVARVSGAFGVFCVVDASVLMECPASKNERFNCPKSVKRLLEEVYNNGAEAHPQFVSFILTKCEKYMASAKGRRELLKAFHEKYDNIVSMLDMTEEPPKVYVLAIQTMCCVSFFKLNDIGLPEFRILPKKDFKTKDCAYPLVILLRNLIEAIKEDSGFWKWLKVFLGIEPDLADYLDELDENIDDPELYEEL